MKKIALWEVVLFLVALPIIIALFAALLHGAYTYSVATNTTHEWKTQERLVEAERRQ
jgi:hypothetical protein